MLFYTFSFSVWRAWFKYSKSGGIFLWINKAFGVKIAYFCLICYLLSCLAYFPTLLYFAANSLVYVLHIKEKSLFIGCFSIFSFCLLTYINFKGIAFTQFINKIFVFLGIVVAFSVLIAVCFVYYFKGFSMQSDYSKGYLPSFDLDTISFASSMMFAFAGLELSGMIISKIKNPQKTYPKAILISAFLIVAIYICGTFCVNYIFPAKQTNILDGILQALDFAGDLIGVNYLPQIMAICLFFGTLGQINSWLIAPIYMLATASKEGIINIYEAKLHPKYNTPYRALFTQAVIVSILCLSCFFVSNIQNIYWTLSAFTTVCYFLPYIAMFLAYLKLKKEQKDNNDEGFELKNKFISIFVALIGFSSVVFALVLSFIAPEGTNKLIHFLQILSAPIIAILIVSFTFKQNCKNKESR
ncbi:amino acid permease [Campylobacter canadensis]|nr:amino acid permease [Campylobacter canadensis]